MEATKKDLPWYVKVVLITFPILSVITNLSVCVVFFIISTKLRIVDVFNIELFQWFRETTTEKSEFTYGLCLTCLFAVFIMITRYMEIEKFYSNCSMSNKMSLYFGSMFVFGKMMVATSLTPLPDKLSLGMYLIGAALYGAAQVSVYFKNYSKHGRYLQSLRFVFCVGVLCNMMLFGAFLKPPGLHVYDKYGLDIEQTITVCVMVNISFQHIWSYYAEKFYQSN